MTTQIPDRRTPVIELVEVPVLSKAEKDELIGSLEEAEIEIARGDGTVFKSGELLADYREHRARSQGKMTASIVFVASRARRDLTVLYEYLNSYSIDVAEYLIARLENQIEGLADPLVTWDFFSITGALYRAKAVQRRQAKQILDCVSRIPREK